MRKGLLLALIAFVTEPLWAADIPDLGGTWVLNVRKSSWGKVRKPASVVVDVAHNQLSLSYSGTIAYENEESRDFSFVGAIDSTEYPSTHSYGSGKMAIRRMNFDTLMSVFRTHDGRYTETVRMVVAGDGRQMTRYIHVKGPDGDVSWVEVYDRR
jgi:type II secretory pathway component PulC